MCRKQREEMAEAFFGARLRRSKELRERFQNRLLSTDRWINLFDTFSDASTQ
jgi:hypothetical protein